MQQAERFRTELLRRGVLLVPVIWGEGRAPQVEKKGFGTSQKAAASLPSIGVRCEGYSLIYQCFFKEHRFCSSLTMSFIGRF